LAVLILSLFTAGCNQTIDGLGCGSKPNCVSSLDARPEYFVEPLRSELSKERSWEILNQILIKQDLGSCSPGAGSPEALDDGSWDLNCQFESDVFGFVDHFSVKWRAKNNYFDLRSYSKTGYSDFGVNRSRVEKVRARFRQLSDESPLQDIAWKMSFSACGAFHCLVS